MAQNNMNIMLTFLDKEEDKIVGILLFIKKPAGSIRNNVKVTCWGKRRHGAKGGLCGRRIFLVSLYCCTT